MALATALAIGATVAGSALSASKSSSNANKAADTAAQNTAANNALTREIYQENKGVLSPYVNTGTAAGALLNDFYGIPTVSASQTTGAQTNPLTATSGNVDWGAYVMGNPDALANWNAIKNTGAGKRFGGDIAAFGQYHYTDDGATRDLSQFTVNPNAQAEAVQALVPAGSSQSAFANYIANSDYGFQQATGNNQVNSGFAGAGTVQSGAAMKALEQYRQNLQSGYRNQWASGVANQQGVGLSAASALAGVSTNYANTIAASNTAASDAQANAALSQQSTLGNALGALGSGILKGFG